jgi:hypothetical protein
MEACSQFLALAALPPGRESAGCTQCLTGDWGRLRDGLRVSGREIFLTLPESELMFIGTVAYGLTSISRTFIWRWHTSGKCWPFWYLSEVSVDLLMGFYTLLTLLHSYLVPFTLWSPAKASRWVAAVWATTTKSIPVNRRTVWNLDRRRWRSCLSACLSCSTYTRHPSDRALLGTRLSGKQKRLW